MLRGQHQAPGGGRERAQRVADGVGRSLRTATLQRGSPAQRPLALAAPLRPDNFAAPVLAAA